MWYNKRKTGVKCMLKRDGDKQLKMTFLTLEELMPEKHFLRDLERCVDFSFIYATVSCDGRTGVEMEALTAVSTAALTVYDMCKAVQKDMVITDIRLLSKTGGVHGDYFREK